MIAACLQALRRLRARVRRERARLARSARRGAARDARRVRGGRPSGDQFIFATAVSRSRAVAWQLAVGVLFESIVVRVQLPPVTPLRAAVGRRPDHDAGAGDVPRRLAASVHARDHGRHRPIQRRRRRSGSPPDIGHDRGLHRAPRPALSARGGGRSSGRRPVALASIWRTQHCASRSSRPRVESR